MKKVKIVEVPEIEMRCTLTVVSLGVLLVTSTHGENTAKNVFGKKEKQEYKFNNNNNKKFKFFLII